ncbi:MAG: BREX-1 system phosphatase PglZ type B, partial [Methanocalculus sp. MSAO_Arc2]|uniref:BREX-1 system phosphatase PglZ type B n=1 Tax=Methanocalculus sp. MSAO_Arc2 TaxID=2293855 RepID=UPI000FF4B15C
LQYRGQIWSHRNGRDWSIAGFLHFNYEIEMQADQATKDALRSSIEKVCQETIQTLKSNQPLKAGFFTSLTHPDEKKRILLWMNAPEEERGKMSPGDWTSFRFICKTDYGFDPQIDGVATAAEKIASQDNKWQQIWERFIETPERFSNIPHLLRNLSLPPFIIFKDSWPQINDEEEKNLHAELLALEQVSAREAAETIQRLEAAHAERRDWVWAEIGESPLAMALFPLNELAKLSTEYTFGGTVDEQAKRYTETLYRADNAIIRSLEYATEPGISKAIATAIRAMSMNWLSARAVEFQRAWISSPPEQVKKMGSPVAGEVILFVDGLRMDCGHRLKKILEDAGQSCSLSYRYSVLPTLTETAKPAVMPIAGELASGEGFAPRTHSGAVAEIQALRRLLDKHSYQVLKDREDGDPSGSAWTEIGNIDHIGHDRGIALASTLDHELVLIGNRVQSLLQSGWKQIRIVTDHGWLLIPGGLQKTELLPAYTAVKKGRCARLLPDAQVAYPVLPWFWDRSVRIAIAPGISCFEAGKEFDHGGLSPEEVVVPEIVVRTGGGTQSVIEVGSPVWRGLRLSVDTGGAEGYKIDIRERPGDPATSLLEAGKIIPADGKVSLVIPDDRFEGTEALIVILDDNGNPLAQRKVIIGGE